VRGNAEAGLFPKKNLVSSACALSSVLDLLAVNLQGNTGNFKISVWGRKNCRFQSFKSSNHSDPEKFVDLARW
jgi:hypothetical protein